MQIGQISITEILIITGGVWGWGRVTDVRYCTFGYIPDIIKAINIIWPLYAV